MVGIVLVRLVEHYQVVLCRLSVNHQLVIDVARGVVGIAEPQHAVIIVGSGEDVAGILILAEGRPGDICLEGEGLCYEVDGLCCPIGDDDITGRNAVVFGYQALQRPRLGLRVMAQQF